MLIPGLILVFGLIYLVSPRIRADAPQILGANGTYKNACCAPLILRNGLMSTGSGYRPATPSPT